MSDSELSVSTDLLKPAACICRSWCRSDLGGQVIDGKRYPGPNHADGCPAQVRGWCKRCDERPLLGSLWVQDYTVRTLADAGKRESANAGDKPPQVGLD